MRKERFCTRPMTGRRMTQPLRTSASARSDNAMAGSGKNGLECSGKTFLIQQAALFWSCYISKYSILIEIAKHPE